MCQVAIPVINLVLLKNILKSIKRMFDQKDHLWSSIGNDMSTLIVSYKEAESTEKV